MLFKRTQQQVVASLAHADAIRADSADDPALDTLVAVLRAYGRGAPDSEFCPADQTQALTDRWVRHATIGHPLDGVGSASGRRDWRGLARAFAEHRRQEAAALANSLGQLRSTVWSFVRSLHSTATAERIEQDALGEQLAGLRGVLEHGTADELRRAAEATLTRFEAALAERRDRQQSQLSELGAQLGVLADQLEEARRASTLDPLTGLSNRKEFDDFLQRLVELHGFVPTPACLFMIDLDGFKRLNDAHGHQAGDAALLQVADALSRTFLRKCDFVSRYGGDEFSVVMRDAPLTAARAHAERLREAVAEIRLPGPARAAQLTLSVGIAELSPGETLEEWVRRADRALYRAKADGRDRVVEAAPGA
ncbi:MAG TPA: GGDEF domain-containing protein [Gemmatimonadaceae bacterium]|nr:GGDEF domain-containing protein [Gemmatimonadaceae bacterium]